MADDVKNRSRLRRPVAVILFLFSLAPSLTCFNLRGLSDEAQRENDDAVMELRTGRVFFDGKELGAISAPPDDAAAAASSELAHVDSAQSDDAGMPQQTLQLENPMASEAAWRRMNPTLHCGPTKMKLKVMGPAANQLQIYTGNAQTLPLIKVPKTCGYSVQHNALGVILVVPYDGCSVTEENGYYVLPLSWLETPVKLACPLPPAKPATTTTQPATTTEPTTTPPAMQPPFYPLPNPYQYPPYYFPYRQNIWHHHKVRPTVPPTSATTTKPTTPPPAMQPPFYPLPNPYQYPTYYFPFPHNIWHHHKVRPTVPPTSTTTKKPTTTPPAMKPPVYPPPNPYEYPPYYFPYPRNIWRHHNPYFSYNPFILPQTSSSSLGQKNPHLHSWHHYDPYMYKIEAGELPDAWKDTAPAGQQSEFQDQAQPHQDLDKQLLLSHPKGQDNPQFNWNDFQPEKA